MRLASGGADAVEFAERFNLEQLRSRFIALGHDSVIVYGEAYGGGEQGMHETYGDRLSFIAFEVQIGSVWLAVPNAADVAAKLCIDFVPWALIPATEEAVNAERDKPSFVAALRGTGTHIREGIVLRPIVELTRSNGTRLMAKHRRDEFRETASPRAIDPERQARWDGAEKIAGEFATDMRLRHVLDGLAAAGAPAATMRDTGRVIAAVIADIKREEGSTIEWTAEAEKALGTAVGALYAKHVKAAKR